MSKVSKAEKKAMKIAAKAEKKATKATVKAEKKAAKVEAKAKKAKAKEIKSYNKLVKKGKADAKKPMIDLY